MNFDSIADHWFAIQVKARYEQTCAQILHNKGYEQFLPLARQACSTPDSFTAANSSPLFPGYVFCRFTTNSRGLILTTPGVIRVLGYAGVPSSLDDEIAKLKLLALTGRPLYPWPNATIGQRVRLTAGPLRGTEGILIKIKGMHRLVLKVELLQRSAAVEVDADWVVQACPMPPQRSEPAA